MLRNKAGECDSRSRRERGREIEFGERINAAGAHAPPPLPTFYLSHILKKEHSVQRGRVVLLLPPAHSAERMSSAEETVKAPPSSRLRILTTPSSTSIA